MVFHSNKKRTPPKYYQRRISLNIRQSTFSFCACFFDERIDFFFGHFIKPILARLSADRANCHPRAQARDHLFHCPSNILQLIFSARAWFTSSVFLCFMVTLRFFATTLPSQAIRQLQIQDHLLGYARYYGWQRLLQRNRHRTLCGLP